MNSTNVESERYSDYFSPTPDISNDAIPKKLKPDNMIWTLSWSEFLNVICSFVLCLISSNYVFHWWNFELFRSLV